jgi:hypothetical protein
MLSLTIRRARWRIWRNEALRRLGVAAFVGALLLLILTMLEAPGWLVAAAPCAALAVGIAHGALTRVSQEDAAIILDRRAGGGDLLPTALSARSGRFQGSILEEADARSKSIDLPALLRFRPSRIARMVPVVLALWLALRVATLGAQTVEETEHPVSSGGASIAVEVEAREIIGEVRSGEAVRADLPDRLREIAEELGMTLSLYAEVEEALRNADPADRERIEDILKSAASRLPEGSEARKAAARGSLAALEEALRGGETRSLEEALLEVRRMGRRQGMEISTGPGAGLPPVSGGLDTAMDREEVPWRYRETVRRYFHREGER